MKQIAKGKFQVETGGGYFFPTAAQAEAWENNLKTFLAIEIPKTLSQDIYLKLCQKYGVSMMDIVKQGYGIEYAEILPSQGWKKMTQYALAYARLMTARAEAKPTIRPVMADYPSGRKLSCGHTVYTQTEVMSASLGSSCTDCYDRMSG